MFGIKATRRRNAERIAGQARDQLTAAVDNAGETTRSATKSVTRRAAGLVDDASTRVTSGTKEAKRRANRAMDALTGRPEPKPWGWLAAAALAGAALAWVASTLSRGIMPGSDRLELPDSLNDDTMAGTRH
jgi:hypothetical protein